MAIASELSLWIAEWPEYPGVYIKRSEYVI
jgi:hypothetical protein